jgi:hypothetical protein
MQHFIYTTNKKGMLHFKKKITCFDESLKKILKKKITDQLLKRMVIILLNLLQIKVK